MKAIALMAGAILLGWTIAQVLKHVFVAAAG